MFSQKHAKVRSKNWCLYKIYPTFMWAIWKFKKKLRLKFFHVFSQKHAKISKFDRKVDLHGYHFDWAGAKTTETSSIQKAKLKVQSLYTPTFWLKLKILWKLKAVWCWKIKSCRLAKMRRCLITSQNLKNEKWKIGKVSGWVFCWVFLAVSGGDSPQNV